MIGIWSEWDNSNDRELSDLTCFYFSLFRFLTKWWRSEYTFVTNKARVCSNPYYMGFIIHKIKRHMFKHMQMFKNLKMHVPTPFITSTLFNGWPRYFRTGSQDSPRDKAALAIDTTGGELRNGVNGFLTSYATDSARFSQHILHI